MSNKNNIKRSTKAIQSTNTSLKQSKDKTTSNPSKTNKLNKNKGKNKDNQTSINISPFSMKRINQKKDKITIKENKNINLIKQKRIEQGMIERFRIKSNINLNNSNNSNSNKLNELNELNNTMNNKPNANNTSNHPTATNITSITSNLTTTPRPSKSSKHHPSSKNIPQNNNKVPKHNSKPKGNINTTKHNKSNSQKRITNIFHMAVYFHYGKSMGNDCRNILTVKIRFSFLLRKLQ